MKDNYSDILNKIKKLLRFKHGGTAAEIETALSLAQKLAAKHGIDINSLNPDDPDLEPISHAPAAVLSRFQIECKLAAILVDEFFNVKSMIARNHHLVSAIIFIGTQSDREIAGYIYDFLVKHSRREWNTKRGRLRNREAFMQGLFFGLKSKLREQEPKQTQVEGIILADPKTRINKYIHEHFPNIGKEEIKSNSNAQAALNAGYKSGRNTNIRPAIKEDQHQTKLIGD